MSEPNMQHPQEPTLFSHEIGVFGMPEETIKERLADLLAGDDPIITVTAAGNETVITVTADPAAEEDTGLPVVEAITERLGSVVYGVDAGTLPQRVVSLLKEGHRRIATAESCTAGMLSERLTTVRGVSDVFECGVAAYSKEIKHQVLGVPESVLKDKGAVSPETAASMAVGVRKVGNADIGIGITGVAGPDPSEDKAVGTVYVALADERRVWIKKLSAGDTGNGDREQVRAVATSYALDMTRRYLEALPGVMAGGQSLEAALPVELTKKAASSGKGALKKTLWITVLLVVLAAAAFLTYVYVLTPYLNQSRYEALQVMYTEEPAENSGDVAYPDGIAAQFMALYRINSDIRGWVTVADTAINYPVVQDSGDGYYALHSFYKKASSYGVPYLPVDARITAQGNSRALVIYGNNADDGQMFADLSAYTELAFLRQHSVIEMNTLFGNGKYKVFAVMIVGEDERYTDNFDYTVNAFAAEDDFLYHVAQIRQRSLFDTPVRVDEYDDLLLLTAPIDYGFDGARIVVVGRKVRTDEGAENDLGKAYPNAHVLMPLAWQIRQGEIKAMTTTTTVAAETTAPTTDAKTAASGKTNATTGTGATTTVTTARKGTTDAKSSAGKTTTTAKKATTTTKKTTTTTTKAPTPPPINPNGGTIVTDTVKESEYLEKFAIKNGDTIEKATTAEELQMLLARVVKTELGNAATMVASTEAQKAQAVASYTYILYYNVTNNAPYPYSPKTLNLNNAYDKKIYDAVGTVLGVKLLDTTKSGMKARLIQSVYHAASGGNTSSSAKVWGGARAYLVSVSSPYDNELTYVKYHGTGDFQSKVSLSRTALYDKIRAWAKENGFTVPESQFTDDTTKIPALLAPRSYDGNGSAGQGDAWNYVYETNFKYQDKNGKTQYIKGHQMRTILGLRSHAYRVSYEAATDTVTLTVQGWGHGVGLSQMGAVGYANEQGWTYDQILCHYYSITAKSACRIVTPVW